MLRTREASYRASQLGAVLGNAPPGPTAHRGPWLDAWVSAHACGHTRPQHAAAPLCLHLMSKEVSGQPEGVTLLECIEEGSVPYPGRMSYVQWLKSRRETGSRPLRKRDGLSTTPEEEAALWRRVMEFLHDVGEGEEEEEEEEEDEEVDLPLRGTRR